MSKRGELYTSKLVVADGKRTYFFNVKQNHRGETFLSIVESIKEDSPEDEERYRRQQIVIYNEHVGEFISDFKKAILQLPPVSGPSNGSLDIPKDINA